MRRQKDGSVYFVDHSTFIMSFELLIFGCQIMLMIIMLSSDSKSTQWKDPRLLNWKHTNVSTHIKYTCVTCASPVLRKQG